VLIQHDAELRALLTRALTSATDTDTDTDTLDALVWSTTDEVALLHAALNSLEADHG
jgi:hypothetical protein